MPQKANFRPRTDRILNTPPQYLVPPQPPKTTTVVAKMAIPAKMYIYVKHCCLYCICPRYFGHTLTFLWQKKLRKFASLSEYISLLKH